MRPFRKRTVAALFALTLAFNVTGCETIRQALRRQPAEPKTDANGDAILDVNSPTPKPFFKDSRLSGAMSDEGRDIEKSLGVR